MYISFFMFIFVLWSHGPMPEHLEFGCRYRSDRQGSSAIGPYGIVHRGIELAQIMRLSHWVRTLGIVFRTYARVEL